MIQLIVCLYLLITIAISFWTKKKAGTAKHFEGNNLGLILCIVAGAGEWLGGTSTTGVSEYGYLYGISGAWYTVANSLGICILAIFFAKMFRRLNTPTVSGIIGKYIGKNAKIFSAGMLIFIMIAVGTSQMVAVGSLGESLFGMDATVSILVLGAGILLYTCLGGMLAVGYTNILHLIVMYAGAILALVLCLGDVGGFDSLTQSLPESYFSPVSIGAPKVISWVIASVLGACTAQAGLQPVLTSKNEETAKKSSFGIAAIVAPFGILMALLGMIAKVKFPELTNAKLALPTLLLSLPTLPSGFVIASLCAAILSTAAPIYLACGTLFTRDIYQQLHPVEDAAHDKKILWISRLTTMAGGAICILLAILLRNSTTILDMVYFAYSLRGSMFIILLLGIFWKRLNPKAAIVAMLMTGLAGFFWIVYKNIFGVYPIHPDFSETYIAILVAFVTCIVGSLLCRKNDQWRNHEKISR